MPKISWMMRTTGVLSFDSGYATNVSTERPSCFTVTHSRCRGDFSRRATAHSCAQSEDAANAANKVTRVIPLLYRTVDYRAYTGIEMSRGLTRRAIMGLITVP